MEDDEKGETHEEGGAEVASVVALLSLSLSSFSPGFENTFCAPPKDPNVSVADP